MAEPEDSEKIAERPTPPPQKTPANSAPDAVKDPNEKTDGKPGLGGGKTQDGDADPGGG